jgi:hypothetical protein
MITFQDLKSCNENGEDFLLQYFNSFEGENIYHKFVNLIGDWERNVSYTINLKNEDKNIKLSLQYVLNELEKYSDDMVFYEKDGVEVSINTPPIFKKNCNILSISDFIYNLKYLGRTIKFSELNDHEKNIILQNLPAKLYNELALFVTNIKTKTVIINNQSLSNLEFNFLSQQPYEMLKGLFLSFDKDYFRDIIYMLSKKIDGNILMKSSLMDIEYYIEKMKNDSNGDLDTNLH